MRKAYYKVILEEYLPEAKVEVTAARHDEANDGSTRHMVEARINGHIFFATGGNYELALREIANGAMHAGVHPCGRPTTKP